MKHIKICFIVFLLLFARKLHSTHLIGGELHYEALGNNKYFIVLKIYRDCGPNNSNETPFDASSHIAIYNVSGGLVQLFNMTLASSQPVPINNSNPCLNPPDNVCVEEGIYSTTITLPASTDPYFIAYQRCCRNGAIVNIDDPDQTGISLTAKIPGSSQVATNSSPHFVNYPPLVLCLSYPFSFDHSATDADGDNLVYSFCTPYAGGDASATGAAPNPPDPPPYTPLSWGSGYSVNDQLHGNPSLSINSNTGIITGTPIEQGFFVVGVSVKEYRNGVLIGETIRDFQFVIANCDPSIIASTPQQASFCQGKEVHFSNNSAGSSFYKWDFGDGTTSIDANPTHTFSAEGVYTITLIANPGWPCADTASISYEVKDPLNISFPDIKPQCVLTNSFQFIGSGDFSPGSIISWGFGPRASIQTSNVLNPPPIVFSDSGKYPITLTIQDGACVETHRDTAIVFPEVKIKFDYPAKDGCLPYTVDFQDKSISWTPLVYEWDFGDGNTSTLASPTHTYTQIGNYSITFKIITDSGCTANLSLTKNNIIDVHPVPKSGFDIHPKEASVYEPLFRIFNESSGGKSIKYLFSSGEVITDISDTIRISESGQIQVAQVVTNEFGCADTTYKYIYIEPKTNIYIPNAFTMDENGINEVFKPIIRDVLKYYLRIYDRWGNLVFETHDSNAFWDGIDAPQALYVYHLLYKDAVNREYEKFGKIMLIR